MFISDALVSLGDPDSGARVRGPLKDLELNKYQTSEALVYPLVLRESTRNDAAYKHYIRFNINIPERSKYKKTGFGGPTEEAGVADWNRFLDKSQLGASSDAISGIHAGIAGGVLEGFDQIRSKLTGKVDETSIFKNSMSFLLAGLDVTRKTKRLAQSITLYVPDLVQQTIANKYDEVSMTDALGRAGYAVGVSQAGGSVIDEFKSGNAMNIFGKGGTGNDKIKSTIAEGLGKVAAESGIFGSGIERVALASVGTAINPQVEVLFQTVSNRTFQFDFRFHPRSQQEAKEVLEIIKAFKFHSAPELLTEEGGGRYFIPPSEFDIQYMFNGAENRALPKISTCVLEGIDINYAQGGQFTSFDDGIPVDIYMVLRFKEVEIIHKDLVTQGY